MILATIALALLAQRDSSTADAPSGDLPLSLSQWRDSDTPAADPVALIPPSILSDPKSVEKPPESLSPESWVALQATPDSSAPRAPQEKKPEPPEFQPPHHSFEDALDTHFSSKAWRYYVWDDYLTTPQVLLPAFFAVSAAAISHWDKTLERHWFGLTGDRGWYSDAGQYTLIGA